MEKKCIVCKEVKEITLFYVDKRNICGHTGRCKDCVKRQNKEWNEKNKDKVAIIKKTWKENNRDKVRETRRLYKAKRKLEDPLFKLKENLRRRTVKAFTVASWRKNTSTKEMLGCEYEELFKYMENKFVDGMNWSNQGEWHIDHIVPLVSATNEEELIKLCNYTNLQPLWAEDNIRKGNKSYY